MISEVMNETINININRVTNSRINQLREGEVIFGRLFSDHMFTADYENGVWSNLEVRPYGDLQLEPSCLVFHYGQAIFEGMKAYKSENGEVLLFRPFKNIERFNTSAKRMCMPEIPTDIFYEGLRELLNLDKEWIPSEDGHSLYIRPFMIATDEYLGVKPSEKYKFMIITSPVGQYYGKPVKVKVETKYSRAASGGTGYAKAAGNYAGALYPAKLAQEEGYDQLIWTDAKEHKYIEESGTMNVMFVIGNKLITPAVSETTLDGVTRSSVLTLAKDFGYEVEERAISVNEVIEAIQIGTLKEAFGTGTAATIAKISLINNEGIDYNLPEINSDSLSNKLLSSLGDIRRGKAEDIHNWVSRI
ncbi:MAG: branched-chain amino acid aminotransferase [Flavobacteriales bacterium]|nr:branched-chain amino acid aminotransferase [Flavobacteriales bacterium]